MGTKLTRCHLCGAPTAFEAKGPQGESITACLSCRRYWTSEDAAPIDIPPNVNISVEWPE